MPGREPILLFTCLNLESLNLRQAAESLYPAFPAFLAENGCQEGKKMKEVMKKEENE